MHVPGVRHFYGPLIAGVAVLTFADTRGPSPSSGVLVVQVGDASTGAFISDAQVRLPSVGRVSRTKWDGEATFAGLADGRYRVEVRAIGYAPGNVDIPVSGDTIPVHFNLERVPAGLDTVRVTANRVMRGLREFDERRQHGIGRFFTDSALIEHRSLGMRSLLATRVPGLRASGNGVVWGDTCMVNVFLDGFMLQPSSTLSERRPPSVDLEPLPLRDVAGMEVYTGTSVPVQYKPHNGACVTVLLWSKW